jgi:hypothetical protein
MSNKLVLFAVALALLVGVGKFVGTAMSTVQGRSASVAATIEPQVLHRHVNVRALPEQQIGDLF